MTSFSTAYGAIIKRYWKGSIWKIIFDTVVPVETNRGKKMAQLRAWIIDLFESETMEEQNSIR